MRRLAAALLLLSLCVTPALAWQSKCPLDLTTCMEQYGQLRHHGWLGIEVDRDTATQVVTILRVVPGGPADQAGIKAGDILQKVDGMDQTWVATKAGWKDAKPLHVALLRGGAKVDYSVQAGVIPEEYLAEMIGVHVLEGHLAYMGDEQKQPELH